MNKRNSDVLVIGAGMSGLVAALAAARRGRKVTVLSRGVGALAMGRPIDDVIKAVRGITCGMKSTSCPDQLAQALEEIRAQ